MTSSNIFRLTDLPIDILHSILNHLQISHQLATLASFLQTSKSMYDITLPHLYREVIIDHLKLASILISLSADPSEETSEGKGSETRREEWRNNFNRTQKLILIGSELEVGAPNVYSRYSRKLKSPDPSLLGTFNNLNAISLDLSSSSLVRESVNMTIKLLDQLCDLKKLCIRLSPSLRPRYRIDQLMEAFRRHRIDFVVHRAVEDFSIACASKCKTIRISYHAPFSKTPRGSPILSPHMMVNLGELVTYRSIEAATAKGLRIVLPPTDQDNQAIQGSIQACRDQIRKWMSRRWLMRDDARFDPEMGYKCLENVEWVYGEGAEKEPPCEVCGMKI